MRLVVFLTIAAALSPSLARAQAWTPPAQSGSISVSFQGVNHTGHLYTDGSYKDESRNLSAAAYLDIEYGITRRLAAAFSVPESGDDTTTTRIRRTRLPSLISADAGMRRFRISDSPRDTA